jgi:hypothetical protein
MDEMVAQVSVPESMSPTILFFSFLLTGRAGLAIISRLIPTGCSSAWLERLVWGQEVVGSNPVTPTALRQVNRTVAPIFTEGKINSSRKSITEGRFSAATYF